MSARNPLLTDPQLSIRGEGNYGVRFTRFVRSGDPGGYRALEFAELFPTAKLRDGRVRDLRREHKGNRRTGPIIEKFEVDVPPLTWFSPAYLQLVVLGGELEQPYGLVRIYDTNPPQYDIRYAQGEQELRRMLADQWAEAYPEPLPGEPRAPYDVFFFTADEPLRLHLVVERDEEADEDSE